jgi:hypothetical protein
VEYEPEITLEYDERQRERFRSIQLVSEWHDKYPCLFDKQDFEFALNQASKGYHFFEWLAAIVLYESLGMLSLVEQYEFKSHKLKQGILDKMLPEKVRTLVVDHKKDFGNVQCPDLFVYTPDYSGWFFCEVKGPKDKIQANQKSFFDSLREASDKTIGLIKFEPFVAPK